MELKITAEKVLEAASKCETAKNVLKTMFPEVFEDDRAFVMHDGNRDFNKNVIVTDANRQHFILSMIGRKFSLSPLYNWEIIDDAYEKYDKGESVKYLVPTKKINK